MARTAVGELQQQIEQVRREAFATGYAAAMQAVRELASRPAAGGAMAAPQRRRGAGRKAAAAITKSRRRARASEAAASPRRQAARRPQRGSNAQVIDEILRASAPRALRQAEIRKALQEKGVEVAFTSIRHALGQLEALNAAEEVGESRTWRHRSGGS